MRAVALALLFAAAPVHANDLGLKIPPNFRVTLWADHTLANDITAMALDDKGRVVVSGPGYVRRLEDTDGDGKADRAVDIADTRTGAMGIVFAFDSEHPDFDLYFAGDGKILGHNGEHKGDRYPLYHEMIKEFPFSEHGGHALKIGPDGFMYAIAGNDARIGQLKRLPASPINKPEGGGIIRFRSYEVPDAEIVAHGFRNSYDFDFTPLGDIITYDSDTERDVLLPWYSSTRVYHLLPGGHHGWRLPGYMRSLRRPDYYPDTVEPLADMGRGSPTGVCCYRHTQFPAHYRGGVFLLDWTFGKVYYLPLIPEGSSYRKVKPEVFLESTGTNGFAPTAARVAPDGSLFVSIGGRGTRGGVYRVEYLVNGEHPVIPQASRDEPIDRVLDAPQPQEAWSEAIWIPLTSQIESEAFERVALSEDETPERRIRALEILVRRKTGVYPSVVATAMKARSPLVRARVAWALATGSSTIAISRLWELAADPHPRVRVAALEGLASWLRSDPRLIHVEEHILSDCLADADNRVRLAASRAVTRLLAQTGSTSDYANRTVQSLWHRVNARSFVALLMAHEQSQMKEFWPSALLALEKADSSDDRVDAIRAIMLAMGDWNLANPKLELYSAYSLGIAQPTEMAYFRLLNRWADKKLLDHFPSDHEPENLEASRLLAMWESDHQQAVDKMLSQITDKSHPTWDFHYLTVLSRLTAAPTNKQTAGVADALLGMERKLAGQHLRIKQNWTVRLGELTGELLKKHPGLNLLLADHPDLPQPGHVVVAAQLSGPARTRAANRFLTAARDQDFPLSPELIDLLSGLPAEEVRPLLRSRWSDRSMRGPIIRELAKKPEPVDRDRFLEVLDTADTETAHIAVNALSDLPRDKTPVNLVPLLARLRQALSEPKEKSLRRELVDLINRQSGQGFFILEGKPGPNGLAEVYRPVFQWFERTHVSEAKRLSGQGPDDEEIRKNLQVANWARGDSDRGAKLYRDRGCQSCHSGSTRLGPDLAGASKRMSREDLIPAVVNPSRDVAPQYRVANVDTRDGKRITGIVVFESAEALIIQTGTTETRRVATDDVDSRSPSSRSLMPDGLLKGLKPEELADLFAFLSRQ